MPNRPMKTARAIANTLTSPSFATALFPSRYLMKIRVDPIEHGSMKPRRPASSMWRQCQFRGFASLGREKTKSWLLIGL
jgi:hypothetical protein